MAGVDIPEVPADADLLRRGRRRGDLPAAGPPTSTRAWPRTRCCGRSTPRRTWPAPRSGCGCSSSSTGAARAPTPSSAATRGCGCGTRRSPSARGARRVAAAHARRGGQRSTCPTERRGPALGLPGDGRAQHGQPARMTLGRRSSGPAAVRHAIRSVSHPATAQTRSRQSLVAHTPSSTRSTSAASPTATATASATSAGIRSRLPYLRDLGVDAIWITPFYPSPMADGGYDVADYRDIEPLVRHASPTPTPLIADAHDLGLRVIIDIVPNHSSDQHEWFQAALAAGPGSPERERYVFRPGRGRARRAGRRTTGSRPSAARPGPRLPDGEWYLHLFAPEQPDFNWENPEVVDGVRGHPALLARPRRRRLPHRRRQLAEEGPELPRRRAEAEAVLVPHEGPHHPFWDRDEVHEVYRGWRSVIDAYGGDRTFVAEAWVDAPSGWPATSAPDELHTAFNFKFVRAPGTPPSCAATIDECLAATATGRRSRDLGAVQPRRHPPRHPLCAGSTHRRRRRRRGPGRAGHPARPRARAAPGPRRDPADAGAARLGLRLPGRGARPAGGRRPARGRRSPTRSGSAPGTACGAGTAAGCRSRGPSTARRSASAAATPGCRSPPTFAGLSVRREQGVAGSTLELYRSGAGAPPGARRSPRPSTGCPRPRGRSRSGGWRRTGPRWCAWSRARTRRCRCRRTTRCWWPAAEPGATVRTARPLLPGDAAVWLRVR